MAQANAIRISSVEDHPVVRVELTYARDLIVRVSLLLSLVNAR
jgi:hypothetical protein